jgi:tRNA (guanine37-N1)-methyltransferase
VDPRLNFTVLSLFPEIVDGYFQSSIMAKSVAKGLIGYKSVNIRDWAQDKHHKCDDAPYGGGAGMLMLPEPLDLCLRDQDAASKRVVYLSPSGRKLDQAMARRLAEERDLVLLCGRYEGVDQRIIDKWVDDEVSIGDYVLSSGEVAALVLIDAVYRLVEGVIAGESLDEESFEDGLLEYPQYTRPEVYDTLRVPEILLSGHHAQIARWRLGKRLEKTLRNRPDLIEKAKGEHRLGPEALALLKEIESQGETE